MTEPGTPKSLKDQNRWPLWLTIAVNFVIFYAVFQADIIEKEGTKGIISAAANLLPVSLAIIITTIANGFFSAEIKAKFVFLRWRYALPGHRAFSKYALTDPRIDVQKLGNKMPATPEDENRAWYQIFKEVEGDPAVQHIHREFLFARDYAAFAVLFFAVFGTASVLIIQSWTVCLLYCSFLLLQFVIVRHAAATYGIRFVCTVLARKAATPKQTPRHS